MKRATKAIILLSAIVLGSLFANHILFVDATADVMSVDDPRVRIDVGESFVLLSRGQARAEADGKMIRALTKLEFQFAIAGKGNHRLHLKVISGRLILNETRFAIDEGKGIVGRPTKGRFNGTTLIGFRLNVSDSEGNRDTVAFLGKVISTDQDKILRFVGKIVVNELDYRWRHVGRIRRS